jgi:hypothetical protein
MDPLRASNTQVSADAAACERLWMASWQNRVLKSALRVIAAVSRARGFGSRDFVVGIDEHDNSFRKHDLGFLIWVRDRGGRMRGLVGAVFGLREMRFRILRRIWKIGWCVRRSAGCVGAGNDLRILLRWAFLGLLRGFSVCFKLQEG